VTFGPKDQPSLAPNRKPKAAGSPGRHQLQKQLTLFVAGRSGRVDAAHSPDREADARSTVLCSSSSGGFRKASSEAAAGKCPVAVIGMQDLQGRQGVVVGVDGSEESPQAVAFAAAEADREGQELTVLYAFSGPDTWIGSGLLTENLAEMLVVEEKLVLSETISGLEVDYPDLVVHDGPDSEARFRQGAGVLRQEQRLRGQSELSLCNEGWSWAILELRPIGNGSTDSRAGVATAAACSWRKNPQMPLFVVDTSPHAFRTEVESEKRKGPNREV